MPVVNMKSDKLTRFTDHMAQCVERGYIDSYSIKRNTVFFSVGDKEYVLNNISKYSTYEFGYLVWWVTSH